MGWPPPSWENAFARSFLNRIALAGMSRHNGRPSRFGTKREGRFLFSRRLPIELIV